MAENTPDFITPPSAEQDLLTEQKNQNLYKNAAVAAVVNVLVSFALYSSLSIERYDWLLIIFACSAFRFALYLWSQKVPADEVNRRSRYRLMLLAILLQGMAWGYASLVLYALIDESERFYLVTVLTGLTGGSILTLSPSFTAFSLFVIPTLTPLISAFLFLEAGIYRYLGSMALIYLLAINAIARRISTTAAEQIVDRQKLEKMFTELEVYKNALENLVAERTRNLKLSEERYRDSFEKAVIGMAVIGLDGKFLRTNPALQMMLGYAPEDFAKLNILDLCPENSTCDWEKQLNPDLRRESPDIVLERQLLRQNGEIAEVRISFRIVHSDMKDAPRQAIAQILDISESKRIEREQARLNEKIRQHQKMEAVGTLAGGISHDFNNILTAIIGYTEMLQRKLGDMPDANRMLQQVLKASQRARHLVQQILVFSRNKGEKREQIEIAGVVEEALELIRQTIPVTVPIKVSIDPASGTILGDASQIHQAVINLCTNAYHAVREIEGEILVRLEPCDRVPSSGQDNSQLAGEAYVQLTVEDSGTGMNPEVRERIFEPFFTTKNQSEGTGMGMAVVYGIVQNHNGQIEIDSEPGVGTKVRILLPRLSTMAQRHPQQESGLPSGTERILLVDDEEMLVELGKQSLEELGYQVSATCSPTSALKMFSSTPADFDLVITDQSMPEFSGLQLAKRLLLIRPDIPIILYTGYSESIDAEGALSAGIAAFLMKPVDQLMLARTVREQLDKGTTEREKGKD